MEGDGTILSDKQTKSETSPGEEMKRWLRTRKTGTRRCSCYARYINTTETKEDVKVIEVLFFFVTVCVRQVLAFRSLEENRFYVKAFLDSSSVNKTIWALYFCPLSLASLDKTCKFRRQKGSNLVLRKNPKFFSFF